MVGTSQAEIMSSPIAVRVQISDLVTDQKPGMLSAAYDSLGDVPILETKNYTHAYTYTPTFNTTMNEWIFSIDKEYLDGAAAIVGYLSSKLNTNLYSCGVKNTTLDLTKPELNSHLFGDDFSNDGVCSLSFDEGFMRVECRQGFGEYDEYACSRPMFPEIKDVGV